MQSICESLGFLGQIKLTTFIRFSFCSQNNGDGDDQL